MGGIKQIGKRAATLDPVIEALKGSSWITEAVILL